MAIEWGKQSAASAGSVRELLRAVPVFTGIGPVDEEDLPPDPLAALVGWLWHAVAAGQPEAHAMTLSTVGPYLMPSSRTLICKDVDAEALYFATSAESRKGQDLAVRPKSAVQFSWPVTGRQVRFSGRASACGRAESEADFAERGRGARLAAHLHDEGKPPADRAAVLAAYAELEARYPGEVPCPESWTLYRFVPEEAEFWQASPDRLHHRVQYRRDAEGGGWVRGLLWP